MDNKGHGNKYINIIFGLIIFTALFLLVVPASVIPWRVMPTIPLPPIATPDASLGLHFTLTDPLPGAGAFSSVVVTDAKFSFGSNWVTLPAVAFDVTNLYQGWSSDGSVFIVKGKCTDDAYNSWKAYPAYYTDTTDFHSSHGEVYLTTTDPWGDPAKPNEHTADFDGTVYFYGTVGGADKILEVPGISSNGMAPYATYGLEAVGPHEGAPYSFHGTTYGLTYTDPLVVIYANGASSDITVDKGATVTFTGGYAGSVPTGRTLKYDFGSSTTQSNDPVLHTFSTPGGYSVTVTSVDAQGLSQAYGYRTLKVTVKDTPPPVPVSSFNVDRSSGNAPLAVQFTDTSSNGPTSWLWDFGDGTTSTQRSPAHTYYNPGTRTVKLTASNAGGPGSVASRSIQTTMSNYALVTANTFPVSMTKNAVYTVSVTMKNTGGSAWSGSSYALLGIWDAGKLDGTSFSLSSGTVVQPGQSYTWTFQVTAPAAAGTYYPVYQMAYNGKTFGQAAFNKVTVK